MKYSSLVLLACLCMTTPCLSEPERFTSDRPSPLKPAKPAKEPDAAVRFLGQVQISGWFRLKWRIIDEKRGHLFARFFPDQESIGLLPYPAGGARVEELLFSNSEEAASILLEPATARRIRAKDLLDVEGAATVTIRDYRIVVECDHRWYLAQLVSASHVQTQVAGVRERRSVEC